MARNPAFLGGCAMYVLAPLFFIPISTAHPLDFHDVQDWLDDPGYVDGGTPKEQIHCYALPYGGIGFLSHVLTYVTVLCLARGRSPWAPWKKLKGRRWNLVMGIVGLLITLPLTGLTMYRCRQNWSFILIGVWKLVFSFTLSTMSIHAARLIQPDLEKQIKSGAKSAFNYRQDSAHRESRVPLVGGAAGMGSTSSLNSSYRHSQYPQHSQASRAGGGGGGAKGPGCEYAKLEAYVSDINLPGQGPSTPATPDPDKPRYVEIWYWAWIYFPGSVVGFVGVMKLVRDHFSTVWRLRTVTYVFGGVVTGLSLLVMLMLCCGSVWSDGGRLKRATYSTLTGFLFCLFLNTVLFAFYIDWVLAALADDMWGVPSSDNAALYWTYFAAKRLPILSF